MSSVQLIKLQTCDIPRIPQNIYATCYILYINKLRSGHETIPCLTNQKNVNKPGRNAIQCNKQMSCRNKFPFMKILLELAKTTRSRVLAKLVVEIAAKSNQGEKHRSIGYFFSLKEVLRCFLFCRLFGGDSRLLI